MINQFEDPALSGFSTQEALRLHPSTRKGTKVLDLRYLIWNGQRWCRVTQVATSAKVLGVRHCFPQILQLRLSMTFRACSKKTSERPTIPKRGLFGLPLRSSNCFRSSSLWQTNIKIDYHYQIHSNPTNTSHTMCKKEKQIKSSHEKSWNKLRKWKLFADPSVRSWPTNPAKITQIRHAGVYRMRKTHAFKQTGKNVGLKDSRTMLYLGFFEENISDWITLNSIYIYIYSSLGITHIVSLLVPGLSYSWWQYPF